MARINDLNAEYNQMLDNRGMYGNRVAHYDHIKTQLDLHAYAVANGFNPTPYKEGRDPGDNDANIPAAIQFLKDKGLFEEASAQAGILSGAKHKGYQGSDPIEALDFQTHYDDAYRVAQNAGLPVQQGMTYSDLSNLASQNQQAFNGAAGAIQTGTPGTIPPAPGTTSPSQAGSQATAAGQQTDAEFQQWMNSQNLSADQKAALKAVYDSISVNDIARAQQVTEAMAAATKYSDPYFKAQISLVTDALSRGLTSQEGDLDFKMTSLQNALQVLNDDITASKGHLSFQHQQEMQGLARKFTADMEQTANQMAATGFTSSSRRSRTEQMISDVNEGAVESSNRNLAFQTGNLNRQQSAADQNTTLQVQNLQRLAAEGKIDLLRGAEEQIGTNNMAQLGYSGLLGQQTGNAIGGQIPRQQVQDALSFAGGSGFVF